MSFTRFMSLAVVMAMLLSATSLSTPSQGLITHKELSADTAVAIVQGAMEKCRADGYHTTVAVIDSEGWLKAYIRDDGTSIVGFDISRRKAWTALAYRKTSAEQVKVWNNVKPPVYVPDAGAPAPGGVPIKVGDEVIGAIGVSGAPEEEACAMAGIAKVADRLRVDSAANALNPRLLQGDHSVKESSGNKPYATISGEYSNPRNRYCCVLVRRDLGKNNERA